MEWSGKLLYTKSSYDFRRKDLIMHALDFIPWDLGDAISTTCRYSDPELSVGIEEYIPDAYSEERMDDDDLQIMSGLCHSHHNMETFFSTTDQPTLIEKSRAFKYGAYLSLIVNHETVWSRSRDWMARIAWHSTWNKKLNTWELRAGTEVVGTTTVPICVWIECPVSFSMETDSLDKDRQRYLQLYPLFINQFFTNKAVRSGFMDELYKEFTGGKIKKWDVKKYEDWVSEYIDIDEWYGPVMDKAIAKLVDSGCVPFDNYCDIKYPIEWVQRKVMSAHLRHLSQFKNITFARHIATMLRAYKKEEDTQ